MKKKTLYIILFIGFSIALAYFLRYKLGVIYNNKVPSYAETIIHVNLREIEHDIFIDAIKNPWDYVSSSSSSKTNEKFLLDGISIPKNIFFFTNSSNLKGTLSSNILNIKDTKAFKTYLEEQGFEKTTKQSLDFYKKNKLAIAIQKEKFLILFEYDKTNTSLNINSLFEETLFLNKDHYVFNEITKSKSEITIKRSDSFMELDFEDGLAKITGKLSNKVDLFTPNNSTIKNENVVVNASGKINTKMVLENSSKYTKDKFKKLTSLSFDSIVQKWNGYFHIDLKSIENKVDTIITYEYDDDFNKTEKKSIQKISHPNLDMKLGGKQLYQYLVTKNAIKVVENDSLLVTIPFLKLHPKNHETYLNLSTHTMDRKDDIKGTNSDRFLLYINFDKYLQNQLDFYTLNKSKRIDLLKMFSAKVDQHNNFSATLNLKNESRSFIGQLIKP